MIRGSGLLSTFFTYKNGSEIDRHGLGRDRHRGPGQERREDLAVEPHHREPADDVRAGVHGDELARRRLSHVHARMDAGLRLVVVRRHDGAEDRRRPGEQPDQPRDASLQRLGERRTGLGRRAGRQRRCPRTSSSTGSSTTGTTTASSCSTGPTTSTAFDTSRWATGNWTFDGNLVDFDPANAVVQDGTLILAITKEGATGFSGTVPGGRRQHRRRRRDHHRTRIPTPAARSAARSRTAPAACARCCSRSASPRAVAAARFPRVLRSLAISKSRLTLAALLVGVLVPGSRVCRRRAPSSSARRPTSTAASKRASDSLPAKGSSAPSFSGRMARRRRRPGTSSTTRRSTPTCRLQTNIWTGKGDAERA